MRILDGQGSLAIFIWNEYKLLEKIIYILVIRKLFALCVIYNIYIYILYIYMIVLRFWKDKIRLEKVKE